MQNLMVWEIGLVVGLILVITDIKLSMRTDKAIDSYTEADHGLKKREGFLLTIRCGLYGLLSMVSLIMVVVTVSQQINI